MENNFPQPLPSSIPKELFVLGSEWKGTTLEIHFCHTQVKPDNTR